TLPGVRLYAARGYAGIERIRWPLGDGVDIEFLPMSKEAPAPRFLVSRATAADAAAILDLQKLAYRSEAQLYDDWSLPPLTQSLDSLRAELAQATALKALEDGRLV